MNVLGFFGLLCFAIAFVILAIRLGRAILYSSLAMPAKAPL